MSLATVTFHPSPFARLRPRVSLRFGRWTNSAIVLTSSFSYSSKLLSPQVLSFDIHTNCPGGGGRFMLRFVEGLRSFVQRDNSSPFFANICAHFLAPSVWCEGSQTLLRSKRSVFYAFGTLHANHVAENPRNSFVFSAFRTLHKNNGDGIPCHSPNSRLALCYSSFSPSRK